MRTLWTVAVVLMCACGSKTPPTDVTSGASRHEEEVEPPSAPDASAAPSASASSVASSMPDAAVAPMTSASAAPAGPPDQCGGTAGPFEVKVRPEVKKCWYEAFKTHPTLTGNVHIGVGVDMQGKMSAVTIAEAKDIGKEGVACMTHAVKAEAFDGSGCKGKSLTFAQMFGPAAR